MKKKAQLKALTAIQSGIKCSLIALQHRQLELLDSITLQMEDSIQEIEIAKQELMEKA